MENLKTRNQNITIPNLISLFRIFLIPIFVYFFLNNYISISIAVLIISGLSDCVDGFIARKFNQITELGKILDPFADKLTQISIAICFVIKFPLLSPLLGVFLCKEILMLILASKLISKLKKPCQAMWYGKLSTILFYVSLSLISLMFYLYEKSTSFWVVSISSLLLTAVLMVFSAIKYFKIYREIISSNESKHDFNLEKELKTKKIS